MSDLPASFFEPRYSRAEAADIVGVPAGTLGSWARGYAFSTSSGDKYSDSLITLAPSFGRLSVPFAGLAQAYVIASLKRAGLPMRRIRPAVMMLREEFGTQEALLSGRLKTDGVELLFEYLESPDAAPDSPSQLAVVRDKRMPIRELVEQDLRTIEYSHNNFVESIYPLKYGDGAVVVDPTLNAGKPSFDDVGVRVSDVMGRIDAGEALADVADDYDLEPDRVRAVLEHVR